MNMNEEYYKFSVTDLYAFKSAIGARSKLRGDEEVFAVCPYCGGGTNMDKDTFSINIKTGQFECKRASCGARGNMITLARDFADWGFSLSKDVGVYYNINGMAQNFKKYKDAHRTVKTTDSAIEYLKSRGIPEEITKRYEITSLPDKPNVLCFPFKDETGEICFLKYRKTDFNPKKDKNKEWTDLGNFKKILFGMYQCEDFETLVITEGQIDSLSCATAGIKNAVSVPTGKNGFTWKPNVWNWLLKFNEIVVFGDRENGEITLSKEISQFYPKKVRVVRIGDYQGCKDANELLQKCGPEALKTAVENAEARVSLRIKNLAEVDNVDLSKIPAYPTGLKTLDDSIGRGFHDGELIILTGKCGEGKSTFASQIVAKMIANNLNVFCYSGELPDYVFKSWLDKQICMGKTSEGARSAASAWYDHKCWIYDNSSVVDEQEEIFGLVVQAIKDIGCKFILIDNLMVAMEDKPKEDLFRQQSAFVTKLTKIAKGYNVMILLVAHPKKGDSDDNDAISGSGDITNRANLVLRYQRKSKKPEDENQSLIKITKNRTTGKLVWEGIAVEYDPESMRIHEPGTAPEILLNLSTEDSFTEVDDLEDIPF